MAKRLGETLIEKGLITRAQLVRALKCQLISGGHLGTSLIELGFLDEETLGRTLAECLNLRYASAQMFDNIRPEVIRLLTPDLVQRYKVIPLGHSQNRLHLAVISPRKLSAMSVSTGFRIVPWVAPEFRILEAMERYYRIPRRVRFVSLTNTLVAPRPTDSKPAPGGPALSPMDERALHDGALTPTSPPRPPEPAPVEVHAVSIGTVAADKPVGSAGDWIGGGPGGVARPAETPETVLVKAGSEEDPQWNLQELAFLVTQADTRDELCNVVLSFASHRLTACALFGVRSEAAYIWGARRLDTRGGAPTAVSLTSNSIFELLLGHEYYLGPVPGTPGCRKFYSALERDPPAEVLLLPIHLNDQLVAILYGESESGKVSAELETFRRVGEKLALGLELVLLKRRIESA
jgi:hypothetical protein